MQVPSVFKVLNIAALTALGALGTMFGYRFFRSELAAAVYRDRLEQAADDYRQLASTYNAAVRRTAVTELLVRDGALRVRIRGLSGVLQEIPTPFDPRGEIYIDYVVIDNRLWIRRVFDSRTAPGDGLIVDPRFINVEWNVEQARYGKAVYRSLSEGRWVVTVTGDGSLGLTRADDGDTVELESAPPVKDYDQVVEQARGQADAITARDVWNWATGR
ncbi:MAG: hypothetical protein KF787_13780 [Phycisphaeraceae bacterium]|nr:hypothetical protein [Phycisphaerae bacterium]MBX3393705.1 hypothetical protein [Phycisphaeraceae bacterium]